MRKRAALLVALSLASTATAAPPSPPACKARVDRLAQALRALAARSPGFLPIVRAIRTPSSAVAGRAFDQHGFVVAVTRDGAYVAAATSIDSAARAHDEIQSKSRHAVEDAAMGSADLDTFVFPIYVWADRDAPAGKVGELVAAARAANHHVEVRLLVAGAPEPAALTASPSPLDAKLPASEPGSTLFVADTLKPQVAACAPMLKAFALGPDDPSALALAIPATLGACDCRLPDVDAFEWAVAQWFGVWAPPLAWIPPPAIAAGDKRPISALVK